MAELPAGPRDSTFASARATSIVPAPNTVSPRTVLFALVRELPPAQQRNASTPRAEVPRGVTVPQRASTAIEPPLAGGRIVLLRVGTDAGPGRWSARADKIVIAAVDVESGRGGLFEMPRALVGLPILRALADLYPDGSRSGLANALYTLGSQRAERFPNAVDPGAAALARFLEQLIGMPIDYSAVVDTSGFVRVVDALGDVTIGVPSPDSTWLFPPLPSEDWMYYEIPAGSVSLEANSPPTDAHARRRGTTTECNVSACPARSDAERTGRRRCDGYPSCSPRSRGLSAPIFPARHCPSSSRWHSVCAPRRS